MRGVVLRLGLFLALVLALPASAADYRIQLDFFTPGYAVMCWEDHHEVQLACYTPNDGFSIYMYPTGRVPRNGDEHPYSGAAVRNPAYRVWKNADFNRKTGGLVQFGNRWTEWQALRLQYTCVSAKTGLTCKNRSGHGWWLGRYKGYRIF